MELSHGSDLIVGLLREAGIEHVAFNPGASFRGIHDSLVHIDGAPAITLCLHEAVAIAIAQGYAKASGKPMAALLHNVVGLQNASMAIYNAWCDRAPMLLIGGTGPKSKAHRRPWIDWIHTASVQAGIVRDFVKWDDEPHDLASVEESFARGLAATAAVPPGPVYLCYDVDLQEDPVPAAFAASGISRYAVPTAPAASTADIAWLSAKLRAASHPVILAGYAGQSAEAFAGLVALAEALGAAVVDTGVRHAFPTTHPLAATHVDSMLAEADVLLALDVEDLQPYLRIAEGAEVLNVTVSTLKLRSWAHDYQQMVPAERHITAEADQVVAALLADFQANPLDAAVEAGPVAAVEAAPVDVAPVDVAPVDVAERRARIGAETARARRNWRETAAKATGDGVVPLDRLLFELARALEGTDFVLGGGTNGRHEHKFLALDRPRQYAGWAAGGGLGYGVGGALGVALAQPPGTVTVDVQADGDLLYLPSALWTAAHKSLPVLIVVHNNRQYGNTVEHAQRIAAQRGHDDSRRYEGAGLADPPVDLAAMARSFGVWAAGPIGGPDDLAERLAEAVAVVRDGRPALLDVLTPGF